MMRNGRSNEISTYENSHKASKKLKDKYLLGTVCEKQIFQKSYGYHKTKYTYSSTYFSSKIFSRTFFWGKNISFFVLFSKHQFLLYLILMIRHISSFNIPHKICSTNRDRTYCRKQLYNSLPETDILQCSHDKTLSFVVMCKYLIIMKKITYLLPQDICNYLIF